MLITHGCRISRVFCSAVLKASEIPHISASNISLFEPRATLRSCHSSLILCFFQTTAAPVLALSSLDPSHQSFKSAIPFCASKIVISVWPSNNQRRRSFRGDTHKVKSGYNDFGYNGILVLAI